MKAKVKEIIIIVLGWSLILVGLVGLFLPFLQGVLFLLAGFCLLARVSPWARKVLKSFRRRFPAAAKNLDKAKIRIKHFLRQFS